MSNFIKKSQLKQKEFDPGEPPTLRGKVKTIDIDSVKKPSPSAPTQHDKSKIYPGAALNPNKMSSVAAMQQSMMNLFEIVLPKFLVGFKKDEKGHYTAPDPSGHSDFGKFLVSNFKTPMGTTEIDEKTQQSKPGYNFGNVLLTLYQLGDKSAPAFADGNWGRKTTTGLKNLSSVVYTFVEIQHQLPSAFDKIKLAEIQKDISQLQIPASDDVLLQWKRNPQELDKKAKINKDIIDKLSEFVKIFLASGLQTIEEYLSEKKPMAVVGGKPEQKARQYSEEEYNTLQKLVSYNAPIKFTFTYIQDVAEGKISKQDTVDVPLSILSRKDKVAFDEIFSKKIGEDNFNKNKQLIYEQFNKLNVKTSAIQLKR